MTVDVPDMPRRPLFTCACGRLFSDPTALASHACSPGGDRDDDKAQSHPTTHPASLCAALHPGKTCEQSTADTIRVLTRRAMGITMHTIEHRNNVETVAWMETFVGAGNAPVHADPVLHIHTADGGVKALALGDLVTRVGDSFVPSRPL